MNIFDQKVIPETGKKAVIYLRVSTEEQVDNFSLGTQEEICNKEANKKGYVITRVFREEGKSAKSITGRPALIQLLEFCRKKKNKIQGLFVYRLDRISRQTSDYLAIRKRLADSGTTIFSATEPTGDSPTEKLIETILAGFAQLDNDIRGERARNGLRARFLSGLALNRPPLGYILKAGRAEKDLQTWDKMIEAWNLMATGTKSLREIAQIMNSWGIQANYNKKKYIIREQNAQRIFRSKFYMGIITSSRYPEEIKGLHEPMINESLFYKVQSILDGRNVNKIPLAKRSSDNCDFPLKRIIRCHLCGSGLTAAWSKGRSARYPYYRCSKSCIGKSIKVEDLETSVQTLLKKVTPKSEALDQFINNISKIFTTRKALLEKRKTKIDQQILELLLKRKVLVSKNLDGLYSDEVYKEQANIIEDKMVRLQVLKEETAFDKYDIKSLKDFIKTKLADLRTTYLNSNPGQIRVLLGSIFPTGLEWNYSGSLNHTISPIYQYILNKDTLGVPFSGVKRSRTADLFLDREAL